ncbi:MAG: TIGR03087 family PEP-CTERM/XrtA system glycosyltransferase [Phycisphaerales bacterium]|nr:MAG: TIGR03087 family PEP-CTERM/XrtA system glycosyltransferase [Phycisphaerales bacterium]
MNILYLAHRIPYPPNKGDKLRSFRQLEYLARRHRVWCACFVDKRSDEQFINALRASCQDVAAIRLNHTRSTMGGLFGLLCGGTVTGSFYDHSAMDAALRRWCESVKFHAVAAFSSSMAHYALQVPARRRVLDLCDLDSQKWLEYAAASRGPARWLYNTEGRRLARNERAWVNAFDATLLITEAEAAALDGAARPGKLHIVGNGVPLPELGDPQGGAAGVSAPQQPVSGAKGAHEFSRPPTVGFVGVMDYRPNVDAVCWFASQCWLDIRALYPEAVFRIVGRSPVRRIRRLATIPGVEVVGGVEDVAEEVRRFDVSVAPMRIARGLQNKVLEAMAAAKPVVLTSKAATGIAGRHAQEFVVADRPSDIVQSVVWLLTDRAERERLGRAARRFVAVHHCWEEALRMFELIVTGALERTARRVSLRRRPVPIQAEGPAMPTGV